MEKKSPLNLEQAEPQRRACPKIHPCIKHGAKLPAWNPCSVLWTPAVIGPGFPGSKELSVTKHASWWHLQRGFPVWNQKGWHPTSAAASPSFWKKICCAHIQPGSAFPLPDLAWFCWAMARAPTLPQDPQKPVPFCGKVSQASSRYKCMTKCMFFKRHLVEQQANKKCF